MNRFQDYVTMNRPYSLEAKIIDFAQTYNAGKSKRFNRSWSGKITYGHGENYFILTHYDTPIVKVPLVMCNEPEILEGIWNSVSDVQGVNKVFNALNMPYHYTKRKGLVKTGKWSNQPD